MRPSARMPKDRAGVDVLPHFLCASNDLYTQELAIYARIFDKVASLSCAFTF